jgi:hypothetical protein
MILTYIFLPTVHSSSLTCSHHQRRKSLTLAWKCLCHPQTCIFFTAA